jgi:hypothetical protein
VANAFLRGESRFVAIARQISSLTTASRVPPCSIAATRFSRQTMPLTTIPATSRAAGETSAEAKSMSIRATSVASEPAGRAPPAHRGECGDERGR